MRLPNQRFRARLKRINQPIVWLILGAIASPTIFLAGCAGGSPSMSRISDFFTGSSATETPTPTATATPSATSTPATTSEAEEVNRHPGKKTARQARAASENSAASAKATANATKQAATAASEAGSDITLEANPAAGAGGTPAAGTGGGTPVSTPSLGSPAASVASATESTPTLSSPAADSPQSASDANPSKAAKLIADIDKIEQRIDRKNLSADDSQRDILAQKLLQEAKKALAERDNAAATSLATKASTLLAPLPKLAESASTLSK
jgi:hypothetical protein